MGDNLVLRPYQKSVAYIGLFASAMSLVFAYEVWFVLSRLSYSLEQLVNDGALMLMLSVSVLGGVLCVVCHGYTITISIARPFCIIRYGIYKLPCKTTRAHISNADTSCDIRTAHFAGDWSVVTLRIAGVTQRFRMPDTDIAALRRFLERVV